jgi:mannose-6-phosphate isomerase-like protein (cupin superfamily)
MPKVSRESAAVVEDHAGIVEDRHEDVEGYSINFFTFRADADATPLLKGLPGDRCSSPHWGYVFKGRITFRLEDHDEVFEAGDAFYLPPGHIPIVEAGTEYLQFSPAEELHRVSETMTRNFEELMQRA